jgi:hypothetical protein
VRNDVEARFFSHSQHMIDERRDVVASDFVERPLVVRARQRDARAKLGDPHVDTA